MRTYRIADTRFGFPGLTANATLAAIADETSMGLGCHPDAVLRLIRGAFDLGVSIDQIGRACDGADKPDALRWRIRCAEDRIRNDAAKRMRRAA